MSTTLTLLDANAAAAVPIPDGESSQTIPPKPGDPTAAGGKTPAVGDAGGSCTVVAEALPISVTVRPTAPRMTPEVTLADLSEEGEEAVLERKFFFANDSSFQLAAKAAVAEHRLRHGSRGVGERRAVASVMQALKKAFDRAANVAAPVAPVGPPAEPSSRPSVGRNAGEAVGEQPAAAEAREAVGAGPVLTEADDDLSAELEPVVDDASADEASSVQRHGRHEPPRPKLAVRTLARGARDAALGLVEFSLPRPDCRLPHRAADFLKTIAARELWVLYVAGADADDPADGSHISFAVLAEAPGKTPEELTALLTEQARSFLGADLETV